MNELSVALLGPLELRINGSLVEVPGSKRRAVLAMLALAQGRVVSNEALIDTLWPDDLPETARQALQSHISRLRRCLVPWSDRLERRGPGYRLDLPVDALDVVLARRIAARLSGTGSAGLSPDAPDRVTAAATALELFRGEPLAEFSDYPALAAYGSGLSQLRDDVRDLWLEARLAAAADGSPDPALVIDAADAAGLDPLRERTTLVWIAALAAAGRTADAMQTAADYRRRLADETGLDPSPRLADLEHEVASGARQPASLPETRIVRPPTPIFGRDRDVAEIHRLLTGHRCVTVTGPGGVGKTRLVNEVAARRSERGPTAVAWVSLAAVSDSTRVCETVAAILKLRVDRPAEPSIADALAGRDLLLVLDNCEHVLASSRDLVRAIQQRAPEVHVLATSRTSLQVAGEYVLRLQPLPVPLPGSPAELSRQPAVRAFVEYADRRRQGAFSLSEDNAQLLIDVLRRLDGLPLAIELAAGQLATVPIEALHQRLGRVLDALTAPRPDDQARHRTLRTTIEWSYRLLSPPAGVLLRHLAVFPAGVDLATIEQLAAELEVTQDPLTVLNELVDSSFIAVDAVARYTMLVTVRAYLLDELAARGELAAAETRFLTWAERTARELGRELIAVDERAADRRLRAELANLGAARVLALRDDALDLPAAISTALIQGTLLRDLPGIWHWTRELANDTRLAGHASEAAVYGAAAISSWLLGDHEGATQWADAGLGLAADDPTAAWACHNAIANAALFRGDFARARDAYDRAAATSGNPGPQHAAAALAAGYAGDRPAARELLNRARDEGRQIRSQASWAFTDYAAAEVTDDVDEAAELYHAAITGARACGARFVEGVALVGLATLLSERGDTRRAAGIYLELVDYWLGTGNLTQLWTTLRNAAALLIDAGDLDSGALLLAAADRAAESSVVAGESARRTRTAQQQLAEREPTNSAGQATESVPDTESISTTLDVARAALSRLLND